MVLISPWADAEIAAAIRALEPYLGDVVVIGGCANALYRHFETAATAPTPIGTSDLDLACAPPIAAAGRKSIATLLHEAGFYADVHPEHRPPIVKFRSSRDPNVDIELLSPLQGSASRRDGSPKVTAEVQPGTSAQQLRYLELLLTEPLAIPAARVAAIGMPESSAAIRVPNPVSYVMQKILIMRDQGRSSADIAKDCYYIYEAAVLFGNAEPLLKQRSKVLRQTSPKWHARFIEMLTREFDSRDARGPLAVVRVRRDSGMGDTPTEEMASRAVMRMAEWME